MIQHAQRVFAVVPGYPYELGQDLPSFSTLYSRLISLSDCILQLSPCRHTQLPRHLLHHPAAASLRGSSLCEATTGRPVTKIVSQCDGNLIVADQLQHSHLRSNYLLCLRHCPRSPSFATRGPL